MPGSAQWIREVQKVCLLIHKGSPQKQEEWQPVSDSTLRRIQIDCELIKKKAKVTTQARKNATTDMRTYITMFAAYQALAVTYGGVLDKQTGMHQFPEQNMFNFDASTGTTFEVDEFVMGKKGSTQPEIVLKKGLRQQYNLVSGCCANGEKTPVLIGIKARKKNGEFTVKPGEPVWIELKDPVIGGVFMEGNHVPSLVVLYHESDKKMLPAWYLDKIMWPMLDRRKLNEGERHVITCDGVGEQIKYIEDEKHQNWLKEKRREFMKGAANATGTCQIQDLLQV